jgi:hypothetical protein
MAIGVAITHYAIVRNSNTLCLEAIANSQNGNTYSEQYQHILSFCGKVLAFGKLAIAFTFCEMAKKAITNPSN